LNFEDNNVQCIFAPSPEKTEVIIRNKTDEEINLIRDKAEFIDHLGESHTVLYGRDFEHEIRLFADNNRHVSPMRIDPGSGITGTTFRLILSINFDGYVSSDMLTFMI